MKDAEVYLRRISLAGLTEARPGGVPVLDSWDEVSAAAERLGLAAALRLFARPSATRDNGVHAGEVVWYGTQAGAISSLRTVASAQRDSVLAELTRGLMALDPLLKDRRVGPVFGAWFNLPSLDDDVLLVNNQVVITNWGLLPQSVAGSVSQRKAHFAAGIGQFLAAGAYSPPFEPDEARIAVAPAAGGLLADGSAEVARQATRPVPGAGLRTDPAQPTVVPVWVAQAHQPWLPVAIAAAIAALLLLLLLIPGVLIYPSLGDAAARAPLDPDLVAQTRNTLESKVRDLQALIRQGVCTPAPGTAGAPVQGNPASPMIPAPSSPGPRGETPKGADTGPAAGTGQPVPAGPPPTAPLLQPAPGSLRGPGSPDGRPSSLIDHLDRVTTLVIAPSARGDGAEFGTGFFINDRHVVTNRHVIEHGSPSRILVINKNSGRANPGRVVGETRSSDIGGEDFALIEVAPEPNRPVMALSSAIARGDAVVAAGFPSFVMSSDTGFQRLLDNDLSAIPDPAVTQGWVTALQTSQSGLGLVVHGATISQGNSGGPLSDLCGRAVGVNTFGRIDTENALRLNFALRAQGLKHFLAERQIAFKSDDTPCDPAKMQAPTGPAQADAPPIDTPAAVAPASRPPPAGTSNRPSGPGQQKQ